MASLLLLRAIFVAHVLQVLEVLVVLVARNLEQLVLLRCIGTSIVHGRVYGIGSLTVAR